MLTHFQRWVRCVRPVTRCRCCFLRHKETTTATVMVTHTHTHTTHKTRCHLSTYEARRDRTIRLRLTIGSPVTSMWQKQNCSIHFLFPPTDKATPCGLIGQEPTAAGRTSSQAIRRDQEQGQHKDDEQRSKISRRCSRIVHAL